MILYGEVSEKYLDLYAQKYSLFIAIRVDKFFFLHLSVQKWR